MRDPAPISTLPPTEDVPLVFTRHFVAHQSAFHGYLASLTGDHHAADDLVQELAGRLWRKFADYDPGRPFVAWGLGFARLLVMEWRRRQTKLPLAVDDETLERLAEEAAGFAASHDEAREALRDCLPRLTDLQRKVLQARYHDDLPVSEIARSWRRSTMAVYKVLHRAHQALLDCMRRTETQPES